MVRAPAINHIAESWFINAGIFQKVGEVLSGKFAVIPFDQRNAFFAGNLAVTNLMGGVGRGSANAELHKSQVVVKAVNPVIQAGILRVSSFTAFRIHRKVVVLLAIVKILLRIPEPVVAAEMDLR